MVPGGLDVGPLLDQAPLPLVGIVGDDDRLLLGVPAFPALSHPKLPVALGAARALALQRRPARHIDDLGPARGQVDPLERNGTDAHAVLHGNRLDDFAGGGRQPFYDLRTGRTVGHRHAASPHSAYSATMSRMSASET
nr:hypothetical protein [Thermostaphylospora chromogena]